jgi:7,8-dihydro-6-hydroxymethylpterin-pyrophosphokinase
MYPHNKTHNQTFVLLPYYKHLYQKLACTFKNTIQ